MADDKDYVFPLKSTLEQDWNDFLDDEVWQELYEDAINDNGDDWHISQTIFNQYMLKYEVPEIIRTTGNNQNFDEDFADVATETRDKNLSIEKFKQRCLSALIKLNLSNESIYLSLTK